jgi:RNA polymerase sigma factor (sigma-70 family)
LVDSEGFFAPTIEGTMAIVSIRAAATGEEAVRALLLSRLDGAYRLATCILRDPAAAEDAVQEAALRAWSRRRSLRDPDRAEAWFARIVVNTCRAELAGRARRPRIAEMDLAVGGDYLHGVQGVHERHELREEVGRAVARLTPDEQVVVAMRFGRDLTVPQIAAHTGLPEGTVKSRLHNAQRHLRAAFEAERRVEEVGR